MKKTFLPFAGLLALIFFAGCTSTPAEPISDDLKPLTIEQSKNSETVVFEEFSDMECPYCKQLHPTMAKLKKSLPELDFRFYHFPLEQIHKTAYPAALSAECVGKIDESKKDEYISLEFAAKNLSIATMKSLAEKVGIDEEKFSTCLKSQETSSVVKAHMAEGKARNVRGTPTLYVNGILYEGDRSYDGLYAFLIAKKQEKKSKK